MKKKGRRMLTSSSIVNRSLFILSGEDSTMPQGELEALVETYSLGSKIRMVDRRVAIVDGAIDPAIISRRGAYIRFGGVHIGAAEAGGGMGFKDLDFDNLPCFKSYAVRVYDFNGSPVEKGLEAALGAAVKDHFPSAKVSLEEPDLLIAGVLTGEDNTLQVCGVDASTIRHGWYERRPRSRPFFHPSVLYPKFARLLVNLAHVKEGAILLDPFSGTGSILVEAGLMGIKSLGVDVSRKMCAGAPKNLRHLEVRNTEVVRGDARFLPVRRVDGVATDMPYGRASSTYQRKPVDIAEDLMVCLESVLPSGKYACIVHLDSTEIPAKTGFEAVQEHLIHIHRQMTRAITVLKRR
jgi:tRNA (guanine10-N2)-dimethyltransferase